MKLTKKQEAFASKYIETGNATEAYRFAYDASKTKPENVWSRASELLKNSKVAARIEELRRGMEERGMITREQVAAEYAKIAFSSIAHLHKTWITRKEFEELTEEQKASIKSIDTKVKNIISAEGISVEVEHIKIELYDKLKALDSISRMYGYDAPKKIELSGVALNVEVIDKNTKSELEKLSQ